MAAKKVKAIAQENGWVQAQDTLTTHGQDQWVKATESDNLSPGQGTTR